ncbi:hypothetical protein COEREDRAFT_80783 [Coemansia reversa NRRL 1564]|uniref:Uncharacterized protein n=1 Tax=Coemansia reversa (strain ATCC 12441 / NRRL 1564) TaxID=763665 RepID=A0A2G5BDI4_COERN|nr:hypothetical protein COEREDRAFT_80783 [Coemansia reversa NRRL 1564]|eukprot:PIA17076.1 hypothetical protein COEREDRAFT_80783 [Coemansia reversa NRRL 1564]
MSQYGGPSYNHLERSYHHGYGPSGSYIAPIGRSDEKMAGEASSYDLLHDNIESQTLYNAQSQQQIVDVDRRNDNYNNRTNERGFKDFFYKKPDPSYSGLYGTDYEPQISKSKVAVAAATAAALLFGYSQHRKRKENSRRFEKYTRSYEGYGNNRSYEGYGNNISSSAYAYNQPCNNRSKY